MLPVPQQLDELEGYYGAGQENEYDRVVQQVETDFGSFPAFMYVYTEEQAKGLAELPCGDWKCRCVRPQHLCTEEK